MNSIPRLVSSEEYAAGFGFQWHKFRTTQVGNPLADEVSRQRFLAATAWRRDQLDGACVLEVGCGAGRFSRVVLEYSAAMLYSVDLSQAVEANMANNGPHPRLKIFQASIYALPFPPRSFDKVFCFGVLQHTPDVRASVLALCDMVRPGGEVVVDFYPVKGWWTWIQAKYILRPLAKRLAPTRLLALIEANIGWMLPAAALARRLGLERVAGRFIPVSDTAATLAPDVDPALRREWAVLDTFDMLSPAYDQPQSIPTVAKWIREGGLNVTWAGPIEYRPGFEAAVVRGTRT